MEALRVNGTEIPEAAIRLEAQNHPAGSPDAAIEAARHALAVRELLVQRARAAGLDAAPEPLDDGRLETDEDALIRQLLEREIALPAADEASCRRYYDNNRRRFRSPDLFEASHILVSAHPDDKPAYAAAAAKAEGLIAELAQRPGRFADLARQHSDCPSAQQGGNLGQLAKGQTVPEFETFLFNLAEGQLCPVPVRTRYGVHVLWLQRKIEGRDLPFEMVRERIAEYLADAVYRRAVAQYIAIVAGTASIEGVQLGGADSPLVQ